MGGVGNLPNTKRGCRAGRRVQLKKKKGKLGEGIYNLSGTTLPREEILTLYKSIKYAPKKGLNKCDTHVGIQKCIRKLKIQKYDMQNLQEKTYVEGAHKVLRNKSIFNPKIIDSKCIIMFRNLVMAELEKLQIKKVYKQHDI